MSNEKEVYQYVLFKCGCNYIKHERAYSAFITLCGYDHQEYELSEKAAKTKLAKRLSKSAHIQQNLSINEF